MTRHKLVAGVGMVLLALTAAAMIVGPFLLGCSTHLTSVDQQALQAQTTLGRAGYHAHATDDGGLDKLRFEVIACGAAGILRRSGSDAGAGDVPCPKGSP